jgi:hypothetical protein
MDLEYPQRQEPLALAILEFNPQKLRERIQRAEEAISKRIQELSFEKDNQHEGPALFDGLAILRRVKKDRWVCSTRKVITVSESLTPLLADPVQYEFRLTDRVS